MTIFRNYSAMKAVGNISLVLAQDGDGNNVVDATFNRYAKFTGVGTEETIRLTLNQFQSANVNVTNNITATSAELEQLNADKSSIVEFKADALALLP